MKKYPAYQSSVLPWIKSIPSHWTWMRNGYLFANHCDKVGNEFDEYQLLSLTTNGVKKKSIDDVKGKVPESYENYQKVFPGDMVFCLFDLDCSAVFSGLSDYHGMITSAYDVAKPNEDVSNPRFLKYFFDAVFSGRYYKIYSKSVRYTINYDSFKTLKSPIPPKEEQDQIVKYLDWKVSEINSFIKKCHSQINMLLELKQAQIDEITIHGNNPDIQLRYSGLDWLGNIPSHWGITKIRNNYRLQNGISESGAFFDKGTPFVNYIDVYNNRILPTTFTDVANSNSDQQRVFSVKAGDIFFTRTSETIDDIGIASICLEDVPKAVFSGFLIRARAFTNVLTPEYMGYYLQSQSVRNYFTKEMNIVIRASLGQNLLKSLYIPVPPQKEQREIVELLNTMTDRFDKMITSIENEIKLLKELRTKIVADAVTGQIDVRGIVIPEYEVQTDDSYDNGIDDEDTFSDDLTE